MPEHESRFHEEVSGFVSALTPEEKRILVDYISIPNQPDIGPEVMGNMMKHGDSFKDMTNRVDALRKKLGLNYSDLQKIFGEVLHID